MWIILYILIILTTITVIPNVVDSFWFPKNVVFILGSLILIASSFFYDSVQRKFKNVWISLIFIYVALSFTYIFLGPLLMAQKGTPVFWNVWNFIPSLNIFLAIMMIKTLVENTDDFHRWLDVAKCIIWVGLFISVYSLFQYVGMEQMPLKNNIFRVDLPTMRAYRMITFFGDKMNNANYIAIISPLCLMFKGLRYKIIYGVLALVVLLSDSTSSCIALVIGLLTYLFLTKSFRIVILVTVLFLVIGFMVGRQHKEFFSYTDTLKVNRIVLSNTKDTPFTGKGMGSLKTENYKFKGTTINTTKFEPMHIYHDGGIILLALVFIYLLTLFKRIITVDCTYLLIGYVSAFMSYLVVFNMSMPLRIAPLALLGIIYISSLESQLQRRSYV